MKYINIPRIAVQGMVILLLSTACTQSIDNPILPKYDVTFTGFKDILGDNKASEEQPYGINDRNKMANSNLYFYMQPVNGLVANNYEFEFANGDIPDTVKVPGVDTGKYRVVMNTWKENDIVTPDRYEYTPLYNWGGFIDLADSNDCKIKMKHLSAKITLKSIGELNDKYFNYELLYQIGVGQRVSMIANKEIGLYGSFDTPVGLSPELSHYRIPTSIKPVKLMFYDIYGETVDEYEIVDAEFIKTKRNKQYTFIVNFESLSSGEVSLTWQETSIR